MTCPECGGAQVPNTAGYDLVLHHALTCSILAAEDARRAADIDKIESRVLATARFVRPATAAERALLAAGGVELAEDAETTVDTHAGSVLSRSWAGVNLEELT